MAKSIHIALSPEALGASQITSALIWTGNLDDSLIHDRAALLAEIERLSSLQGEIIVNATGYDTDHPLGPVMKLDGPRGSLEVIVPWRHIRSIVIDPTGKMPMGFHGPTTAVQKSKSKGTRS